MKGYIDTIENFLSTSTDDIVRDLKAIYPEAQASQVQSWITLINDIKSAENIKDVTEECVIALEYSLPTDGMAIDCTILGLDSNEQKTAVLIESKQWDDDYISRQQFSSYRGEDTELHPQVQISRHKLSFSDYLNVGCHSTARAGDDGFTINSLDPASPIYRDDLAKGITQIGSYFTKG